MTFCSENFLVRAEFRNSCTIDYFTIVVVFSLSKKARLVVRVVSLREISLSKNHASFTVWRTLSV